MSPTRPRSLCEAFQTTAQRYADEAALRTADGTVELRWAEYAAAVERTAAGLAGIGVRRGDTVALMLRNRPEFHVYDMAVTHLGATPFSLYQTSAPPQIAEILANARPRVIVTEPAFLDRIRESRSGDEPIVLLGGAEAGTLTEDELARSAPTAAQFDFARRWRAVGPDDVATLIYTTGPRKA